MSKNSQSNPSKRAASAFPSAKKKRGGNNKKRKLPTTFLDSASLDIVVGPPPERKLYTTPVAADVLKEVFLDRLVKELVTPFLRKPDGTKEKKKVAAMEYRHVMKDGKLVKQMVPSVVVKEEKNDEKSEEDIEANRVWKERIVVGTNQCSRLLENLANEDKEQKSSGHPTLIVLARDIYPPTMLAHVPQLAQQLQIPVLLLPGQACLELGKALKMQRTSIIMFLAASLGQKRDDDEETDPIDSFVEFIKDQMPKQVQPQPS